jgi:hypothetical protein
MSLVNRDKKNRSRARRFRTVDRRGGRSYYRHR